MSIDVVKEFGFIKPLVSEDTTPEQLYIFSIKLCNNEIDSDFDKLSPEFLKQFAELVTASPIPLIKDHRWTAENQVGRVYRAEVIKDGKNSIGEPFQYVLGYAYVAADNEDIVNRVKLGLLSEVSVGFDGTDYKCSVCGADVRCWDYSCPNGHMFGSLIDGKPAYRIVGGCSAAMECSFVPVPAQDGAAVETKSDKKEGFTLKRSEFFKRLGFKSKKADETTAETKTEVPAVPTDEEVTDADIEALIAENATLKQELADLKATAEADKTERIKAAFCKAVEGASPIPAFTGKLKESVLSGVDLSGLKMAVTGDVEGVEELLEQFKGEYPELFSAVADAESEAKTDEPEAETEPVTPETPAEPEDKSATKARVPHVVERPAEQSIKARVNHATSNQFAKVRVPYAVEH